MAAPVSLAVGVNRRAINLVTNRPILDQTSADLSVDGGNYSTAKAEGAVNLPVGDTDFAGVEQVAGMNGQMLRRACQFQIEGAHRSLRPAGGFRPLALSERYTVGAAVKFVTPYRDKTP
jgi:hypothetical protein